MIPTVETQAVVIGAGPAGLAAALRLRELGVRELLVLEREAEPGGVLRQCIHDGFGLARFGEALTGPEYAARLWEPLDRQGISLLTGATVTGLTAGRTVTAVTRSGLLQIRAGAVILAMGCRERAAGALPIAGPRPAGVFTAGVAQTYLNLKNTMVGRDAVILGSGDIGMIMARRLTLEGARVRGVFEILPYASGLPRNVEQCLRDYDIPLHLSHTVTRLHGSARLTAVTVSRVDEARRPIPGTEQEIPCDTLILSVGLIPENELTRMAGAVLDPGTGGPLVDEHFQTTVPGIFAAGNVLHVHDVADYASLEAEQLARAAAQFLQGGLEPCPIPVSGEGCTHVVPQRISGRRDVTLSFRPGCPARGGAVEIYQDGTLLLQRTIPWTVPAQMEHLQLPAGALRSHSPVKVVFHP